MPNMFKALVTAQLIGAGALIALPAAAQDTLKIGAINPYSGPLALYGDETTRGYELAAEEINVKGGLLGRQIEVIRGSATNPQEAIAAVEKLASVDGAELFVGTFTSAVSNAGSEAALAYNKIYWDTNALAAELTERGLPNFVRSGPSAMTFAQVSADAILTMAAEEIGKDPADLKVWVAHEDSVYGTSIGTFEKQFLEEGGAQVIGTSAYSAKSIDMTDIVLRLREAQPDVLVTTGYVPDTNLLMRAMRDQGYRPPVIMFTGTADTKETLEAMGADFLDGVMVVTYPRYDINESFGPGSTGYLEAYRAKYNADPIAPQSMNAYVGFKVMAEVLEQAGSTDPVAVRAAALAFKKPVGSYATGFGVEFDENAQNVLALPTVAQWQSGAVVTVFPPEARPEGAELIPFTK